MQSRDILGRRLQSHQEAQAGGVEVEAQAAALGRAKLALHQRGCAGMHCCGADDAPMIASMSPRRVPACSSAIRAAAAPMPAAVSSCGVAALDHAGRALDQALGHPESLA